MRKNQINYTIKEKDCLPAVVSWSTYKTEIVVNKQRFFGAVSEFSSPSLLSQIKNPTKFYLPPLPLNLEEKVNAWLCSSIYDFRLLFPNAEDEWRRTTRVVEEGFGWGTRSKKAEKDKEGRKKFRKRLYISTPNHNLLSRTYETKKGFQLSTFKSWKKQFCIFRYFYGPSSFYNLNSLWLIYFIGLDYVSITWRVTTE